MALPNNSELLRQFDKHKKISESLLDKQHNQAKNCHAFFAGDKSVYYPNGQNGSVLNKIKPFIDAVVGRMIQLRRKPEYNAHVADNAQQLEFSQYLNSLSDYFRSNGNFDQIESRQDREMLITGYGAVDTNIIFETNPDGEIKAELIPYNSVLWDPEAKETNLLDARWVIRRKKMNREEALKRFDDAKEEDFSAPTDDNENDLVYNPFGGEYTAINIGGCSNQEEDLVEVFSYQYWNLEKYWRALNPLFNIPEEDQELLQEVSETMRNMLDIRVNENNQEEDVIDDYFEFNPLEKTLVMTPEIKNDLVALFKEFDLEFEPFEELKRVYYTIILTETKILKKFRSQDQQGFTVKFKTGDFDVKKKIWFGMVTALKDPSIFLNKAFTESLRVIAANSKGGVMYERGAVSNPRLFEQQYAKTDSSVQVEEGALSGGKIEPKASPALPTGYADIYNIANVSLGEVTGVNKEFLGNAENKQVSALFEQQRIDQVSANLASYFDSITLYQKEHAKSMITYMRILAENSTGRLVKLIGLDGAVRFEELREDKMIEEYDVDVGEAPTTEAQKRDLLQTLLAMAQQLGVLGVKELYALLPQYMPIKQSDKKKIIDIVAPPPNEQQAQALQAQAELQQQIQQLQIEGQRARIAKDMADTQVKFNSIESQDIEDNKTIAEMNNIRADTVKTLTEAEKTNQENQLIRTNNQIQQNVADISRNVAQNLDNALRQ